MIINRSPSYGELGNAIDWDRLEEVFGKSYYPYNVRLAVITRLMTAFHHLKYIFSLSMKTGLRLKAIKTNHLNIAILFEDRP